MRRAIYVVLLTFAASICFCSLSYLTFAIRERAEIVEDESGYAYLGPQLPDLLDPRITNLPEFEKFLRSKRSKQPSDKDASDEQAEKHPGWVDEEYKLDEPEANSSLADAAAMFLNQTNSTQITEEMYRRFKTLHSSQLNNMSEADKEKMFKMFFKKVKTYVVSLRMIFLCLT